MDSRTVPETQGFDHVVRTLVARSPWWLVSLAVHLAVLAVLWRIPVGRRPSPPTGGFVSQMPEPRDDIDDLPEADEPDVPEETVPVHPLPADEEPVPASESDFPPDDVPVGAEGPSEGPFTGAGENADIGLGDGSKGGGGGHGSRRRRGFRERRGRTRGAVESGLRWLADHQDVQGDGRWDCDDFMKHDPADDRCDGAGGALYDVGVSGLALLAFLGAGYTDRGSATENPFGAHVREGLRYLMRVQDEQGCFGTRSSERFLYNHAIAALAMSEAYWMTRNPRYKKPAQQGLNFIARARNPYLAWRYEPRGGDNDTSMTGWMVMALKSGHYGGLEIDPDAFEGARSWIGKMTDPEFGTVGYDMPGGESARPEGLQDRFPPEKTRAMTAVGMLCRIFLGEDPRTSRPIRLGADLCLECPPSWNPGDGSIDMYYWYYATLALWQVGGNHWRRWNDAMVEAVVKSQHPEGAGSRTGSWDPIGPWGPDGGRVYSTAVMTLCLEVYYRYDRVFGTR